MGPYIKDVCKIFGFLDPLPPCPNFGLISITPHYVCFWTNPPLFGRPSCMVPNLKYKISSCDRKGNWPKIMYTGARFLLCQLREQGRPTTPTATYSSLLAGKTSTERCSTQQKCSQRENGLPSPTCLQQPKGNRLDALVPSIRLIRFSSCNTHAC